MTEAGTSIPPRPQPFALSDAEHAAIARVFEGGPSVFGALSTLRTRRMGLGYRSETGEEETFDWSSHLLVRQREGPLSFESASPPIRLSEVEEALVAWAALGPNGPLRPPGEPQRLARLNARPAPTPAGN